MYYFPIDITIANHVAGEEYEWRMMETMITRLARYQSKNVYLRTKPDNGIKNRIKVNIVIDRKQDMKHNDKFEFNQSEFNKIIKSSSNQKV